MPKGIISLLKLSQQSSGPCLIEAENNTVDIKGSKYTNSFNFEGVFVNDNDNSQLFQAGIKPLIDSSLVGMQADTLFTFMGPPNACKSETVFSDDGVLMRSIAHLFQQIKDKPLVDIAVLRKKFNNVVGSGKSTGLDEGFAVTMSFFEIYGDSCKDLLSNLETQSKAGSSVVIDSIDMKIKPKGISQGYVSNLKAANDWITKGLNYRASRGDESTCFVYLNLINVTGEGFTQSRVTMVDLCSFKRGAHMAISEVGGCFQRLKTNNIDKSVLRTNKLARLIFHEYLKNKESRLTVVATLDSHSDETTIMQTIRYVNPSRGAPKPSIKRHSLATPKPPIIASRQTAHKQVRSVSDSGNPFTKLKNQVKELEEKLENTANELAETVSQKEKLEKVMNELVSEKQELISRIAELTQINGDAESQINILTEQSTVKSMEISKLEERLKILESESTNSSIAISPAKARRARALTPLTVDLSAKENAPPSDDVKLSPLGKAKPSLSPSKRSPAKRIASPRKASPAKARPTKSPAEDSVQENQLPRRITRSRSASPVKPLGELEVTQSKRSVSPTKSPRRQIKLRKTNVPLFTDEDDEEIAF